MGKGYAIAMIAVRLLHERDIRDSDGKGYINGKKYNAMWRTNTGCRRGLGAKPLHPMPPLSTLRSPVLSLVEVGRTAPGIREPDWSILMARAQDGDGAAYRRLLEEIAPHIRSLAAKWCRDPDEVEDAVQDTLLTIHAVRQTYNPARPFGPWLVAIAKRRIVDRLRRSGVRRERETSLTHEHETFPAAQANNPAEALERRALRLAIHQLPIGQRQAIELLKLREMSLKEAAASTGMSITALKVATHRGLKALRRLLAGGEETR